MCGFVLYPTVSEDGDQDALARNSRTESGARTIYTFVSLNGSSVLELGAKGAYNGSSGIYDTFFSIIAYSVDLCPSFPKANCFCYDST